MDKLEKTLEKFWKDIKKKPNVVGYSSTLKPKIVDGKADPKRKVIRVYVSKKVPKSELSTQDLVPEVVANGSDFIETDVIEIGEIKALGCYSGTPKQSIEDIEAASADGRQDRHRPLVIGPSAMGTWTNATACTLGGFAINKKPGENEFVGILANNHCYPSYVEVLTEDGYKKWQDTSPSDKFATLTEQGIIEYHSPTNYFKLDWTGKPLIKLYGHNYSFTVTPGQNIYGADAWFHSNRQEKFRLSPVEYLVNRLNSGKTTTMRMKRTGTWIGKDNERFTEDIIEFLGWYITEGSACVNSIGQNIVSIRQRENRHYDEIYDCMKTLCDKTWRCKSAIVSNSQTLHQLLIDLGLYSVHAKDKFIPTIVKSLPLPKLRLLLDTMLKGDGSNSRVTQYFTSSKRLSDDVSEICLKLGIPTNITVDINPTNYAESRTLYVVHFLKRDTPIVHGIENIQNYQGDVYDVTVPNNTLLVREEGTSIWSGNCCAQENKAATGTHYVQPSPYDGGGPPADTIGHLWRFVPIQFNGFTCFFRNLAWRVWKIMVPQNLANTVDIGFVKLREDVDYNVEVHSIGEIHGKREAVEGDIVAKFGRTTGLTAGGNVIDTDWSGSVKYSRGTVHFRDCVLVVGNRFSQGGDSSSFTFAYEGNDPVTSINREYIGNPFAGSDTHSIICKYGNVESRLEVEVMI